MGLKSFHDTYLVVKGGESEDGFLVNDDIRPLALKDRKWNRLTYLTFWFSATATVSNWYSASTGQALGLSMWESLACSFGGQCLIAIIITLNGRAGATYHIGFPVLCRTAFGIYGAWWPAFNRAVMSIVWNGVNSVQGGQCIYVMLHACFPGVARIKNTMGSGSALTTGGMIGFIIFWFIMCFFLVVPVPKMRGLIYAKVVVFFVCAIAMLAWTATKAGGLGPVVHQGGTAHGSARHWLIFRFIMLGAANCATFASNAADFQRYATKNSDVILGNLVGFPVSNFIVAIFGNLVCASGQVIFGRIVWNPITLLDDLLVLDYSAKTRAGAFFIALCFAYSCIFSAIFENSLPAGNDIAALFPKYVTVRRGFFICAVLTVAINPWYLLGSAVIFVRFLSSYQIFLSTIAGILLVQYYLISRGRILIPDCYTSNRAGAYHYWHGFNLRAFAAYFIGIAPNFYGFLNNMGVHAPKGITRFYYVAYWVGLFLSGVVYWSASKMWPPAHVEPSWAEPRDYVRPEEDDYVIEASSSVEVMAGSGGLEKRAVTSKTESV